MAEETFSRRLSGEEAQKRFIIISKEKLALFPKPGVPFDLTLNGQSVKAEIRLHQVPRPGTRKNVIEYRLDLAKYAALYQPRFGQKVTIQKSADNTYSLIL
ncbi:MAG: hypothetical protein ONA69_00245 [candidate division KSB1 bacterium]|nr:hypothetical protein [candidate division KSB1 bacterium]MDZ7345201.1 hypothetical protein [candidate division KSB1 bacterium]